MKFEYHVKPTGSDAACGDAEHPFATISKAAQMASPGDTVIVHEGAYREQVDPKRGGLSEHERITYCSTRNPHPYHAAADRIRLPTSSIRRRKHR